MGSTAAHTRMHWMDALRGLAVVLVILMHSTNLPAQHDDSLEIPIATVVSESLSPYRMPLLLLLSGMLLSKSIHRKLSHYYWGKIRRIVWPLLVWGVITAVAQGHPEHIGSLPYWLNGPLHLWFLGVLALYYALGPLLRWIPALVVATSIYLGMVIFPVDEFLIRRVLYYGVFFFLGAAARPHLGIIVKRGLWFPVVTGILGVLVAIASASTIIRIHPDGEPSWELSALFGLAAIVWAGPRLPRMPWLEFAGRRSLVLYVTHMPIMVYFTIHYHQLAHISPVTFYGLQIILGLGIPVVMALAYHRVRYLYELPANRPSRSAPNSPLRQQGFDLPVLPTLQADTLAVQSMMKSRKT